MSANTVTVAASAVSATNTAASLAAMITAASIRAAASLAPPPPAAAACGEDNCVRRRLPATAGILELPKSSSCNRFATSGNGS